MVAGVVETAGMRGPTILHPPPLKSDSPHFLTESAMRPTALTASLAMRGLMSLAYSVSSPTMSYLQVKTDASGARAGAM